MYYCNLTEKGQITRNIDNKKKKRLYRKSVLLLLFITVCRKLGSDGSAQQKIKVAFV